MTQTTLPPRPTMHDSIVIVEGIKLLLPQLMKWGKYPASDEGGIFAQLLEACDYAGDTDAYALAKYLDDKFSWKPDVTLIDILDGLQGRVNHAARLATEDWVKANGVTTTYPKGTRIRFVPTGELATTILAGVHAIHSNGDEVATAELYVAAPRPALGDYLCSREWPDGPGCPDLYVIAHERILSHVLPATEPVDRDVPAPEPAGAGAPG